MPRLHTKMEMHSLAMAASAAMILRQHMGIVYEARDYQTGEPSPAADRTVWIPLTSEDLMDMGHTLGITFANKQEFASWQYMITQAAGRVKHAIPHVVIRHGDGLAYLTDLGILPITEPGFAPNYINHVIIDKEEDRYDSVDKLFKTISEWVGSEAQAHSLLYHLSTSLQPGWSAVKYVLLLGKNGRNGKGTLLAMFLKLLGERNVSGILRQDIAARRSIIRSLNNKLANVVFDGPQTYVSESGPEKTIVAGERLQIELKFENEPFTVQTNALFIEALNREPKARDKSEALQKRLVRFSFPNEYEKDIEFEELMQADTSIDALLTLLWEHWVPKTDLRKALAISEESKDLQINYDMDRSALLAYLEAKAREDSDLLRKIQSGSYSAETLVTSLQPWMQQQGYEGHNATAVWELMSEHFVIRRTTSRTTGRPVTQRVIISVLPDTARAMDAMQGALDEEDAVVRGE